MAPWILYLPVKVGYCLFCLCGASSSRWGRRCTLVMYEDEYEVYPVISYQYDTSATLDEFAKEISSTSGVSEGETISVLKDFRTLLKKTLLGGRSVNIAGLGYFFLAAQSKGTEKPEDFTAADIDRWHRDTSPDLNGDGVIEPYKYVKACPCFDVREFLRSGRDLLFVLLVVLAVPGLLSGCRSKREVVLWGMLDL